MRIILFAVALTAALTGNTWAQSGTWANPEPRIGLIDINNGLGVVSPDVQWLDPDDPTFSTRIPAEDGDAIRFEAGAGTSVTSNGTAYWVVNASEDGFVFQIAETPGGAPLVVPSGEFDSPQGVAYLHWDNPDNWADGLVANGADETATFGNTIPHQRPMLDSDITLGHIEYTGLGTNDLEIYGGSSAAPNTITFETTVGMPSITTTSDGAGNPNRFLAFVNNNSAGAGLNIAGTQGLRLNFFIPEGATATGARPAEDQPEGTVTVTGIRMSTGVTWDGFSGPIVLEQGNLDPIAADLLPASRLVLGEAGTDNYARLGLFNGRHQSIGGLDGNANSFLANNGDDVGTTATLTLGAGDQDGAFAGSIGVDGGDVANGTFRSNIGITKTGAGVQRLNGTSYAAGTTTVDGGTLLVNGSHVATATTEGHLASTANTDAADSFGQYALNDGGTLGGTGTIKPFDLDMATDPEGAALFMIGVNDGGVINPGDSGIGTLTLDGADSDAALLNFAPDEGAGGGRAVFDVGSGGDSDILAIIGGQAGDVIFNNTVLDFDPLAGAADGDFTLFTADVADAYAGLTVGADDVITGGLSIGAGLAAGSALKLVGNDIVVSAVIGGGGGVPGDYNGDGVVDAADYAVWRDLLGQNVTLTNEVDGVTPGMVTAEDYSAWRERYGTATGAGDITSAPEPTSMLCVLLLAAGGIVRRWGSRAGGRLALKSG